ncbi:MAG: MerR family transcriptional regulator [Kofleriaceae bacterium]|nr:MerR family transcriptional regulator [Kofleriaceae bacterium]MBP6841781.1 MerR family transcriptional regulator [Kofleriaceae bacterium]MBP9206420.1 MerR family transcriptional regulator [Kofleriaceae bacterium]
MTLSRARSGAAVPRYRIGAVARLTGVSTHAIRVWEKRYATVRPSRTAGGDRLYSEADIQRLRALRRLIGLGHAIGDIAALPVAELDHLLELHLTPTVDAPSGDAVARYLACLGRMDVAGAEAVLEASIATLGRREVIEQVLAPLVQQIGARWQAGDLQVAHEHAATAMLRTHLGGLLRLFVPDPTARGAIATTPAGEPHELGALMAALVAASVGWRVTYLGPNLPAAEIVLAARQAGAELVLLSCAAIDPAQTQAELTRLAALAPRGLRVVVGGAGLDRVRTVPARLARVGSLIELERLLS